MAGGVLLAAALVHLLPDAQQARVFFCFLLDPFFVAFQIFIVDLETHFFLFLV